MLPFSPVDSARSMADRLEIDLPRCLGQRLVPPRARALTPCTARAAAALALAYVAGVMVSRVVAR
eukprot:scaffold170587_cov31-Tisochrysis_lutea.AAC.2